MFNAAYVKLLAERAITVFASALAALLGAGAVNLLEVPWVDAIGTAAGAAFVAVLLSVGGGAATSSNSPALTSKETEVAVEKDAPASSY